MHISCVICSDLFVPVSDVFVTGCGHLFHYPCLIQWIERSKSCPQCRNKTTEKTIHRIYFNVASSETEEDVSLMHNKIDNLKFQIHLKDTDIKNTAEENQKLTNQNKGLSIQIIVQGTTAEVEDMLDKHGDSYDSRKSLATYVSVLKREIQAASEKKRDFRDRLKIYHRDLSAAILEKNRLNEDLKLKSKLNKQLEDDLQHLEHEKKSLQKKIHDLEKAISSPSGKNPRDSALQRLILESPIPEAVKIPRLTDPAETDTSTSTMFGALLSPESKAQQKFEPASPYLNIKSCSFGLTPLKGSQSMNLQLPSGSNKFSIFRKPNHERPNSSAAANPEEAYDGLGGHSKADLFPIPSTKFKPTNKKLKPISISKTKKQVTVSHKLEMFFDST
ncbi:E3 ubiquitin-protein ligase TRAIP isoform X2 [Cryptotermes secundus]|nr:E3 ubiquitin-protein ligase TRAIP isoform X2 [Cryptotermes secundus]